VNPGTRLLTTTAGDAAASTRQPPLRQFGSAVLKVLPAWLVARAVVAVTLVVAHLSVAHLRPGNSAAWLRVHQGLLGWDAGWYQSIAAHGYAASGQQSLRFFPAFPLAGRVVGWIPGVGPGTGVIIVANACGLAAMAVLWILVERDLGDRALARRSVWLLALASPAFTLVMAYAEGALLLCTTVTLLAIRTGRWWWAALAGLVAGAVRPVGLLLIVPVVIEAIRTGRTERSARSAGGLIARSAAVLAPVVGTGAYLAWVSHRFGDAFLPFRLQDQPGHRGVITSPLSSMWHDLVAASHGHHLGSALHIPWVILCLALLVVAFRRLPLSYAAFAAAVLVVSVASSNLDSFERYALSGFPLVIAASTLTSRRGVEPVVLGVAGLGLAGYSLLAFLGIFVP
jgi:hypothetical protein